MDCVPSHFETDCRVTFICSANSSCDHPLFFCEAVSVCLQKSFLFPPRVVFVMDKVYQITWLHTTNQHYPMCQLLVASRFLAENLKNFLRFLKTLKNL